MLNKRMQWSAAWTTTSGKNLVICSDGTGNSAGKGRGTNVWKTYEALDRSLGSPPLQLAVYQDGVGTSSFKPLALLGGAFGFGLARNVKELYAWLALHYSPGDRIYLFGFSRGGFTVRCLCGLITHFGIVDGNALTTAELKGATHSVWMAYKESQQGSRIAWRQRLLRQWTHFSGETETKPRGLLSRLFGRKPHRLHKVGPAAKDDPGVDVHFIGVWDTVSAYGLPFDLLTAVLSRSMRFLIPIPFFGRFTMTRFRNRVLHRRVHHARHALALDDERQTFHPLPWDARQREDASGDSSLEQIWFSGMHADVGGGYPRGSLSLVSLNWMLDEAKGCGLRVRDPAVEDIRDSMNPLGPVHDSRSGTGAFYRYLPRDVGTICRTHGMTTKVHESVTQRMALAPEETPPKTLPPIFHVVGDGGITQFRLPSPRHLPELKDAEKRARWLYMGALTAVLGLLLIGWLAGPQVRGLPAPGWGPVGPVLSYLEAANSGFVGNVIGGLRRLPSWFILLLSLASALEVARRRTMGRVADLARNIWRSPLSALTYPDALELAEYARPRFQWLARLTTWAERQREWVKDLASVAAVGAVVAGSVALISRDGGAPVPGETIEVEPAGAALLAPATFRLEASDPGHGQRIYLAANTVYSIVLDSFEGWTDGSLAATPQAGITDPLPLALRATPFFKRDSSHPWFALIGVTGNINQQAFLVGDSTQVGPFAEDRRLYLFANDATCYYCFSPFFGGPWRYYENNGGSAWIIVAPVEPTS